MSEGRKKRSVTATTTGTSKADLLGNLSLAGKSGPTNLTRETKTFTKNLGLGWNDDSDVKEGMNLVTGQAQQAASSLVDISQEQIDNLNIRFQQRAEEVLRRNTFQGREQLILTNRV